MIYPEPKTDEGTENVLSMCEGLPFDSCDIEHGIEQTHGLCHGTTGSMETI